MNIIEELRQLYPKFGFNLHDDGVIVSIRGGYKYVMTISEAKAMVNQIKEIDSKKEMSR